MVASCAVAKAIVLGATGLVGSQLLSLLLEDPRIDRVVSIGRRASGRTHEKLEDAIVDLTDEAQLARITRGDVLFSMLGTTLKKAGSKQAQWEVDVGHQLRVAKAAAANRVSKYVLVSSLGANKDSPLFYNRIKGELEHEVQKLGFERVRIMRPSLLLGDRRERRPGEAIGEWVMGTFKYVPGLRTLRPIQARTVARAMVTAAFDDKTGAHIHGPHDLFAMGGEA